MTLSGMLRSMCVGVVVLAAGACGGESRTEPAAAAPAGSPPAASASAPAAATTANPCPLTVEQVAAITGTPMTLPPGGCTFFPANGRDVPHVFYVLQTPMVCNSIKPGEIGFTEKVDGLEAREAYVRDQIDGSHVLVCPNGNARAFDIVVDIKNNKAQNREAAIALAKQVLGAR
jgi:hypothetical protein